MRYHIYSKDKKINENYREAYAEFQKRLSPYSDVSLHLSNDLAFVQETHPDKHHFLLVRPGISTYSSEEFARYLNILQQNGRSTFHVIIGFSKEEFFSSLPGNTIPDALDYIALTKSSLPAKTLTLLFLEQLYRGYTILQGKTYHK